ncbi:MAG: hypothetical protein PHV68_03690 [Candidatus Gastranaerophilales bacterium]|nr:hypothetical protein [Candidatus Gastranaerophilales bacterium]
MTITSVKHSNLSELLSSHIEATKEELMQAKVEFADVTRSNEAGNYKIAHELDKKCSKLEGHIEAFNMVVGLITKLA